VEDKDKPLFKYFGAGHLTDKESSGGREDLESGL
jgi:hypothetical protein